MTFEEVEKERYEGLLKTQFKIKSCPKCGGEGREMIGEGRCIYLCGIPLFPLIGTVGNIVVCQKCKFASRAYREPWKAIYDWNNTKLNSGENNDS